MRYLFLRIENVRDNFMCKIANQSTAKAFKIAVICKKKGRLLKGDLKFNSFFWLINNQFFNGYFIILYYLKHIHSSSHIFNVEHGWCRCDI